MTAEELYREAPVRVGEQLKAARIEAGVSKRAFAQRMGVAPARVTVIERGHESLTLRTIERYLGVLSMRPEYVLREPFQVYARMDDGSMVPVGPS